MNLNRTSRPTIAILTIASMTLLMTSVVGCRHDVYTAPPPVAAPPQVVVAPPPQRTHPVTTEEWVAVPIRILYPLGGSRLDDEARAMLREVHSSMASRTDIIRISVEGHTDSRGMRETNERLGIERAQGVVDFLVGDLGLPRELFEVHGFGDTRPITSCTTAADCLQNRRVEFRMLVRRTAAM
jgi:outer membrane protein OmpA-like peptidoglycan-associated protein